MRKTIRQNLSIIVAVVALFFSVGKTSVFAQSLKLQLVNPQQQVAVGDSFQVKILINTAGVDSINADALMTFEPAKVSIDSATSENFFTYFSSTPLIGNPNQYLVSSWEESVAHAKKSSTDIALATMTLTAKTAGTTSLVFVCTPGTEADSNINRASDSQDILTNCSSLTPLTLTIGGSSSSGTTPTVTPAGQITGIPAPTAIPTETPTPTLTPTPSLTSTPRPTNSPVPSVTSLPRAGSVGTTLAAFGMAAALLTVGGLLFIL